jgi:hypothetical protein
LTPSIGAGVAHADHMLQMMRDGVTYQNAFAPCRNTNFNAATGA